MQTLIYPETLQEIIHIAKRYAGEYQHEYIEPAHALRALMHNEIGLKGFVTSLGHDPHFISEWAEVRMEDLPRTLKAATPVPSTVMIAVFDEADNVRSRLGLDEISPVCLLAALCKPHVGFSSQQLKTFPIREADIMNLYAKNGEGKPLGTNGTQKAFVAESTGALYKYCTNKTAMAREEKLDPVVGRDRELRMMMEILSRRNKSHVLLIGEPGVGKTALIDGFSQLIARGDVPLLLKDAHLFELNLSRLAAGAAYKGEVEDRLNHVIDEVKKQGKGILLIEEIQVLLDPKNPFFAGVAGLLKPELAGNEIIFVATTTLEEYRKTIEPDKAFSRRFETITISEPDLTTCVKILEMAAPAYERHHRVRVNRGALDECVRLAKRYMKDKRLPDAALDLLDITMASLQLTGETSQQALEGLTEKFRALEGQTPPSEERDRAAELKWLHTELSNRISPVLLGMLTDETTPEDLETAEEIGAYLEAKLQELSRLAEQKFELVDKNELAAVVSYQTGIPIGKIQAGEKERLLNMEAYLKRRVIGQDQGLKVITDAIIESRSGINKPGQPIGSFFFLGPTGTGKTELTKSIAEFLFNDEKAMIRFDMSEFKEEHSAALLYGAPPGYVGYEEGGMLVNKIRQNPYSVVLFDEIEKAHRSVFDVFLQIMDEGTIHDKLGKEGDFSNALIIFTSNIGSDWIVEKFGRDETPRQSDMLEIMSHHFRPEFLGRLTEIVPFRPISEANVVRILEVQLKPLTSTLDKMGIRLTLTPEAKEYLALHGFTPQYGARPIAGIIRNHIRRPLSKMLIAGQVNKGTTVTLHYDGQDLKWDTQPSEADPKKN